MFSFELFDAKYLIDPNDPRFSNLTMKWKRYEYVNYTLVTDLGKTSKNDYFT